jgi:hypothetical protein
LTRRRRLLAQGNTYERLKKIIVEQLGVDEGDVVRGRSQR